jgi:hypothetical protein
LIQLQSRPDVLLRRTLPLALGLVALLAACGPAQGPPDDFYEVEPTRKCLEDAGFRISTDPDDVGLITLSAPAGGFLAYLPGERNRLTIAFGNTNEEAQQIVRGFQAQAQTPQQRRRLRSLLEGQGNAVLVWITEPTLADQELVRGCLK